MKKPRLMVIGGMFMDLVLKASGMPRKGGALFGEDLRMAPGGKGANQAVAAARLGAEVTMVGRVGDDLFGQYLLERLKSEGINTNYIHRDGEAVTGVVLTIIDASGEKSILVTPGANMRCGQEDIDTVEDELRASDVVLLQLEIPIQTVDHAIGLARRHGIPIILDAGPICQGHFPENLGQVDILSPNERETEALTGKRITNLKDAELAAQNLLSRGVKIVVLKLGERGAMIADARGIRHIRGVEVPAVDTTAAGDAFTAALALAWGNGRTIDQATTYANHVGALTVTRSGAQPSLPTRVEVEEFIKLRKDQQWKRFV